MNLKHLLGVKRGSQPKLMDDGGRWHFLYNLLRQDRIRPLLFSEMAGPDPSDQVTEMLCGQRGVGRLALG